MNLIRNEKILMAKIIDVFLNTNGMYDVAVYTGVAP